MYQNKSAEAEPLLSRALRLREEKLGREHPDVAQALNNLGLCYLHQKRYAEGESFFLRARAINEKAFGVNDIRIGYDSII
jgi:hypothetical protein